MSNEHRCPFCGNEAHVVIGPIYYWGECMFPVCGATGPKKPTVAEALAAFCNLPAAQAPGPLKKVERVAIQVNVYECGFIVVPRQCNSPGGRLSPNTDAHAKYFVEVDLPLPKAAVVKGR